MVILAYDVSEMTKLLDVHKLASHLDIQPLHLYKNEDLVVATIAADDYALLAVMPTTSCWEMDMATSQGSVTVPRDYWRNHYFPEDLLEALRLEVYRRTGWSYHHRLPCLVDALRTQ